MDGNTGAFDESGPLLADKFEPEIFLPDIWPGVFETDDIPHRAFIPEALTITVSPTPTQSSLVSTPVPLYTSSRQIGSQPSNAGNYEKMGIRWRPIRSSNDDPDNNIASPSPSTGGDLTNLDMASLGLRRHSSEGDAHVRQGKNEHHKAQNRLAQRNYRARQVARLNDSNAEVEVVKQEKSDLEKTNNALLVENKRLREELEGLRAKYATAVTTEEMVAGVWT